MMVIRSRDVALARTERSQAPSDTGVKLAGPARIPGAVTGTARAILSNCQRSLPMSSSPVNDNLGMLPR